MHDTFECLRERSRSAWFVTTMVHLLSAMSKLSMTSLSATNFGARRSGFSRSSSLSKSLSPEKQYFGSQSPLTPFDLKDAMITDPGLLMTAVFVLSVILGLLLSKLVEKDSTKHQQQPVWIFAFTLHFALIYFGNLSTGSSYLEAIPWSYIIFTDTFILKNLDDLTKPFQAEALPRLSIVWTESNILSGLGFATYHQYGFSALLMNIVKSRLVILTFHHDKNLFCIYIGEIGVFLMLAWLDYTFVLPSKLKTILTLALNLIPTTVASFDVLYWT